MNILLEATKTCPQGKVLNDWNTCVPAQDPYTDALGIKSVRIHGSIAVLNAFLPLILYHGWINSKPWWDRAYHNIYYHAWQLFWILHFILYFFPALMWGFTLLDNNKVDWLFVNWFKWMYYPLWGVVGLNAIMFFVALLDSNATNETSWWEVFIVTVIYYGIGAIDMYFSIIWYDYLIDWYPYKWNETRDEAISDL